MTIIQTVAGGAGGSGGQAIDLSGSNEPITGISWNAASGGTKYIAQSGYDYRKKTIYVDAGDGLICKTQMGYVGKAISYAYTKTLSGLVTEIQTILNRSDSGVPNLPNGSYTLYIGRDDGDSATCAIIDALNTGTGTCQFAEVYITVSNGSVTVVSTKGYLIGPSADSAYSIAIYGIEKTA